MTTRGLLVLSCFVLAASAAPGAPASAEVSSSSCVAAERTLASVARASGPLWYHDSTGETRGPDICGDNLVTNDNEGTITFGLHITNRNGFAPADAYGVFLDTDLSTATGPGGADWRVRIGGDGNPLVSKWNGTDAFVPTEVALSPAVWVREFGGPIFQLNAADIGGAQRFTFVFFATDGANVDGAPNQGAWSYQMTPLVLSAGAVRLDPARSGKTFSARLAVTRSDFAAPLDEGEIACSAKIGARAVSGRGRFAGERVACSFRLPRGTRGKRIIGTISVTFQGVVASRAFSARIR
jgi:hypothetical protein